MAFAYLSLYPVLEALQNFCSGLKQFAKAQGKENLYHETITWAYVFLVRERMSGAQEWECFASANPDLLNWKNSILKKYYREETLKSEKARRVFVMPDKQH